MEGRIAMRFVSFTLAFGVLLATAISGTPGAQQPPASSEIGPTFAYIGPLAVGPDDVLFAGDAQDVSVYALHLGKHAQGGTPGTKNVADIDQQIAAMTGTDRANITITDMVVYPKTRNTFMSAMRGRGADAVAVLLRVDGAGKIEVIPFEQLRYSKLKLPNPPGKITPLPLAGGRELAIPNYPDNRSNERPLNLFGVQTITHIAYYEGRLFVAGLSNEEFASKLRSIPYPFKTVDRGTSVEIWHGSHGQFETRSPIYTFVPYKIAGVPHLIAGYLCTPLVKFPIASLKPGADVRGETIAELGNGNRPLDMIIYTKNGQDFLLMSNNVRGVMKLPTSGFATAAPITKQVAGNERIGIQPEPVASLKGIEQLDLLDNDRALVLARAENRGLNLESVPLP
jgi:hypothetical protein